LLALTAAFVLSFSALSIIVVQVAQKSQELERTRRARALVDALAQTLAENAIAAQRTRALAALVGHADVVGVRLEEQGGADVRFGESRGTARANTLLPTGERLSLWISARDAEQLTPLAGLLRLYSFVTGALILSVVYILLTRLIVRPVENLTNAVERLPSEAEASIRVVGAAELVRLAVAFNRMARELQRDKRALEARLHELEETARVLRSTQDQLIRSEKLAGVGRLAAGIAHEIGNPLAAILGLVELLQMGGVSSAESGEFLGRIRNETERIHRIIRDLLDYARMHPGEAATHEDADLEEVLEEAVALIAPQKDLRRVTVERRVFASHVRVRGSAHELTQVVVNLLLNAADAVGGEGHVLIELTAEEGRVALAVSDSGPGIPSQVLDKLFEPFVTTKPVGKGTGLGLAVCHAVVQRLGGTIHGENLARQGARFTVRLPRV
jgi:two-component system, NtrC family, sensor kinase